jgi:hypothetical protein
LLNKEELIELHKKSQDTSEQQLSYISAGCLALSIGFLKDIVKDIMHAHLRSFLMTGWILMVFTLLMNLVSHLLAAKFYSISLSEIDKPNFDPIKSDKRFKGITFINWMCVVALTLGILLVVIFVNYNL